MNEELKIDYEMPNGHTSTAYVTRERDDQEILRGVNKHTDEPVAVRWTGEKWVQLPTRPSSTLRA